MTETNINKKILEKLEKISHNPAELNMCKEMLDKEIYWFNLEDPPFRHDFPQMMENYFSFKDDENV